MYFCLTSQFGFIQAMKGTPTTLVAFMVRVERASKLHTASYLHQRKKARNLYRQILVE
jgi:hypothetical protein